MIVVVFGGQISSIISVTDIIVNFLCNIISQEYLGIVGGELVSVLLGLNLNLCGS